MEVSQTHGKLSRDVSQRGVGLERVRLELRDRRTSGFAIHPLHGAGVERGLGTRVV